ncbi:MULTISPECIES: anthranilate synthase component I [unclassified Marinobacter]|uniref:anthranilate synthase component I n=1 Tax=unclassified Marinobacter TaxID=83889 RepID=UPI0026E1BF26|nr:MULTISPECIES: anthranilate synthase component I [unclassified Marinobacter]MDO6441400.1 anthranilate synthase component I [Marinobacter sp. 2_MG-2023]MDO6822421.1 anthranilate synthase component I [Marinobacter sp. 1_MG-2023]
MTFEQFRKLAQAGFNRIPVYREVLADMDTPLSTYLKLASGPYSYLFESVQGGEKWGRYSIIGLPSQEVLKVYDHRVEIRQHGELVETAEVDDPLAFVAGYQERFNAPDLEELPRFNGGLVGYFGYDTVRYIEKRLAATCPPDRIGTPDILLMVSNELVVFDNLRGKLHLIVHVDPTDEGGYEQAQRRLDELEQQLHRQTANAPQTPAHLRGKTVDESEFVSGFSQEKFEAAVDKIKDYVLDGDVMQTVISQRMSIPFEAPPLNLYRSLRVLNPSPYMYYLDLDDFHIVGSSPEILARMEDREVTVRPIAGTRKRGATEAEDRALEAELLADPKEIAEHLMLIDLGRNDAGRVSETGTVRLTEKMAVERYSHVMHIVSNVTGRVKDGTSCLDVLKATLPAGTLSGAPKTRAMEIIDELEPVKRGVYGGAVGYLSFNGNMDTAIAIRTAVIKDKTLHIQAGAGIVADSVPRLEWKETMNKGRAIFRAVAMTYNDFDH